MTAAMTKSDRIFINVEIVVNVWIVLNTGGEYSVLSIDQTIPIHQTVRCINCNFIKSTEITRIIAGFSLLLS